MRDTNGIYTQTEWKLTKKKTSNRVSRLMDNWIYILSTYMKELRSRSDCEIYIFFIIYYMRGNGDRPKKDM